MKKHGNCRNMTDIREAIDAIDNQIVALIAKRSDYIKLAAKFKTNERSVRDDERVKAVIDSKIKLAVEYGVSPELVAALYKTMITFFINQELEEWKSK